KGAGPVGGAGFAAHPGAEPAPDVPAAGHRRQVVAVTEDVELRQPLEHAEIEGRAPDTAARESESDEVQVQRAKKGRPATLPRPAVGQRSTVGPPRLVDLF